VARATAGAIAKLLGDALVAPVIPFAPAVEPGPVSAYPGTIYLSEEAFCALLLDVVASLAQHGFEEVVLLGDGQASQVALRQSAKEVAKAQAGLRVHYVKEFGDEAALSEWTAAHGIVEKSEGMKDDFATSAMLMAVDPDAVRMEERIARGLFSINGVSLAPAYNTMALGRRLIEHRAEVVAAAIRRLRGEDES
jgi:creatinine amidohydrolase/Fe(II)-dependent formamide hydrolase-like protein